MGSSRWRAGAALVALGLGVASCSSEPQSTAPTVELSTTSVTTLPTTTTAPPSTEAPTTTEDPRIAEVEAAVAGLRSAQVKVLVDPSVGVEELGGFAEGEFLQGLIDNTLKARADGRTFEGAFDSTLLETSARSDAEITVLECGHDRVAVVDSAGATIVPADPGPVLRLITVRYVAEADGWRVSGIEFVGEERQACEL